MRLKEFNKEKEWRKLQRRLYWNKSIIILSSMVVILLIIFLYQSFAIFEVKQTFNIINAKVGTFTKGGGSTKRTIVDGDMTIDYDINMIPVSYDASNQTVKADVTNVNATYKWYDYSSFRWANVVLVSDTNRETYKSATPGTPITETDILAYLVYVPRYRYQIFNYSDPPIGVPVQQINVAFENKNTAKSNGSTNGTWLTHPAFTFGSTELNGIWVGKFETSGYTADATTNTCMSSQSAANCDNPNILPVIKANVSSLRYQSVSNEYITALKFKSNVMYGISSSSIDTHMMKNMEWGAVAYLSQSIYGKNGNTTYGGTTWSSPDKEIYKNNSSGYITGRSMGAPGGAGLKTPSLEYISAGYYTYDGKCATIHANLTDGSGCNTGSVEQDMLNKNLSYGASTTGTIYGIYDMSGGAYEYVMGNEAASGESVPGPINPGSSGFNGSTVPYPDTKYYDSYLYAASLTYPTTFTRGYLGDATREILTCTNSTSCGWYGDSSLFVNSTGMWFSRGGSYNGTADAGAFDFYYNAGIASHYISFRLSTVIE